MKKRIIKWGKASLILLILLITAFISFLYSKQERLVFASSKLPVDYVFDFDQPFEEINLTTEDGINLNGIHFRVDSPRGVLLYFHGNTGNLSRWGYVAEDFTKLNYDVLVVDYRTYGKSTGDIDESKMLDDTQVWYNYLLQEYDESDVVVYGRSIGTGFATFVASNNNPRKLLLETPFYNLYDVAKRKFYLIPFLDKLMTIKLESNKYIAKVTAPVIIYHGTNDRVVAYDSGKKLGELLPNKQLSFYTIPSANHHNIASFQLYQETISASLSR